MGKVDVEAANAKFNAAYADAAEAATPPPPPPSPAVASSVPASLVAPDDDPTLEGSRLALRLRGLWALNLAPRWQLGVEVARALASLGLLTEASALFAELHLWEEFVIAMGALGHTAKAEEYAPPCRLHSNPRPRAGARDPRPGASAMDPLPMTNTLLTLFLNPSP